MREAASRLAEAAGMTQPRPAPGADHTAVLLHPLTFVDEGDQVVIGRPDIDSFAVFPADAAAVVRRLSAGEAPAAVAGWYEAAYGEPADIDDFLQTLRELEFIRTGEWQPAAGGQPAARWRRLGAAALSAPALTLYALAAGAALYLMIAVPALRPLPSKVFISRSLLVVLGVTAAAQIAGVAWHEWFHVLAGRRLGLPSKFSVGRRLFFLVFQTTLVGLLGVSARRRILPFLAGLIADTIFVSVVTGLAAVSRLAGWPPWTVAVAVAVVYVTLLRMLWQAMIFMETDLYHVLASLLRCPDLHQMTRHYLSGQVRRLRGGSATAAGEADWSARDRRIVRRYAPFVLAGSTAMIGLAAVTVYPLMAGLTARAYDGIVTGHLTSLWFWDALAAAAAVLSQFVAVALIAIRDRRTRRAWLTTADRPGHV
jgi:hypothetical protein